MTPEWDLAACRDTDTEGFYPDNHEEFELRRMALRICERCDIRDACLEFALGTPENEDYGIWGGTTRGRRKRMRCERGTCTHISCATKKAA